MKSKRVGKERQGTKANAKIWCIQWPTEAVPVTSLLQLLHHAPICEDRVCHRPWKVDLSCPLDRASHGNRFDRWLHDMVSSINERVMVF